MIEFASFEPIKIIIDYKPNRRMPSSISKSRLVDLLNLIPLEGAEISLKAVELRGVCLPLQMTNSIQD